MALPTATGTATKIPDPVVEREAPATGTTIAIRLRRQPNCPICGAPIRNSVLTIRYDVAFCPPCANVHAYDTLRVSQLLRHPELARHFSTAAGIHWFTPPDLTRLSLASIANAAGLQGLYLSLPLDPWGYQIHHAPEHFDPTLLTHPRTPPQLRNENGTSYAPDTAR